MARISSHPRDGVLRVLALLGAVTFVLGCPGFGTGELPDLGGDDAPQCEQVLEILDARCTRCHGPTPANGAPEGIRLDQFDDSADALGIQTLMPLILAHTESGMMPPIGEPEAPFPDSERAVLEAWFGAGMPTEECEGGGSTDTGLDAGLDTGIDAGDVGEADADATDAAQEIPDIEDPPPTTAEVHAAIFAVHCASHHIDSGTQLPRLDLEDLETRLQNSSVQLPSMQWITPGDPDESYLFHKISGTHRDVGGSGFRMPIGPALTGDEIDLVEEWIKGLD